MWTLRATYRSRAEFKPISHQVIAKHHAKARSHVDDVPGRILANSRHTRRCPARPLGMLSSRPYKGLLHHSCAAVECLLPRSVMLARQEKILTGRVPTWRKYYHKLHRYSEVTPPSRFCLPSWRPWTAANGPERRLTARTRMSWLRAKSRAPLSPSVLSSYMKRGQVHGPSSTRPSP